MLSEDRKSSPSHQFGIGNNDGNEKTQLNKNVDQHLDNLLETKGSLITLLQRDDGENSYNESAEGKEDFTDKKLQCKYSRTNSQESLGTAINTTTSLITGSMQSALNTAAFIAAKTSCEETSTAETSSIGSEQSNTNISSKRRRGRPPLASLNTGNGYNNSNWTRNEEPSVSCYSDRTDKSSLLGEIRTTAASSSLTECISPRAEYSSYFYTAMPVTPSHQQTARTKLSSSIRISTHQIIASLMTNEPQSIRELHHLLSKLHQEYYVEMAELLSIASSTSNSARRTPHSAVEQAAKLNTPSVLISEQQILAILDVLQVMGLVVAVARVVKSDADFEVVGPGGTSDASLSKKRKSSDIASTSNTSGSSDSSGNTEMMEEKDENLFDGIKKLNKTEHYQPYPNKRAQTQYDCYNHFETALYTMAGRVKGPAPLGAGCSDICNSARPEAGKLPIMSNLSVDTEARLRNTENVRSRITKLKELAGLMKKDYQNNNINVRRKRSNSSSNSGCEGKSTRSSNNNDNLKSEAEGEVIPDTNARLLKDHRVHFHKYLTKAFETMKSSADNMDSNGDGDVLYRTVYLELEASMRHTSHTI